MSKKEKNNTFKSLARTLAVITILLLSIQSNAQTKSEVDDFFDRTVMQLNAQKKNFDNELNQLINASYDRKLTELTMKFRSVVLEKTGRNSLTEDQKIMTKTELTNTACNAFGAFMRVHNLRVMYVYFDARTNKEIFKVGVTKRDCK